MRVLLTTDTIGGVWTFTRELCKGYLTSGHEVALISFGRTPSTEQTAWAAETAAAYGSRFCYEASSTPLEWMDDNRDAYESGEQILLQTANEFVPDVVHANQFCFGALPLSIPRIITAHSDVLSWARACRPDGLEDSEWLRRYRSMVGEGLRGADVVVAPTAWMAEALSHSFPASAHARVISNGRTLPPRFEISERKLQAASAGRRWDEAKQAGMLDGLDAAMPVIVAGETSLNGEGLSESELLALFRRSSVYLASSRYEPFGLAPLEAALCGCAVVANDIPSLREVWADAALYYSGTQTLRDLLKSLADAPEELRCAGERSRQRALQFSAEKMVKEYLALYAEVCSKDIQATMRAGVVYAS